MSELESNPDSTRGKRKSTDESMLLSPISPSLWYEFPTFLPYFNLTDRFAALVGPSREKVTPMKPNF